MTTIKQLIRGAVKRKKKYHRFRAPVLKHCPQKRGSCVNTRIEKPKKPNSAERKVAIVDLSTGRRIRAAIPGIGHNVNRYSRVIVRGGRTRDLVGIRCKLIRGKYDVAPVANRKTSRSKYGIAKPVIR